MASDSSIYGMIRQPEQHPGPMDMMAKQLQLKHLIDSGQLNALQRQQIERGIAQEDATEAAYRDSQGDPKTLLNLLYGKGLYKPAQAAEKAAFDKQKSVADLEKTRAETFGIATKQLRDQIAQLAPGEDTASIKEATMALFGPDMGAKMIARYPATVTTEWQTKMVMTADEQIKRLSPAGVSQDRGGTVGLVNPYSGADIGPRVQKTLTPDGAAADRRASEQAARDKFGPPQEVTGPNGKPMLVMQRKSDGALVDVNTREPIAKAAPKVGETAQKQQIGVQNTRAAINEYLDALENFAPTDILIPDARAKMGTVYNNMLLQAKEAFNLGVLNGPDYTILQEVITSPTSLKGGITSKEALKEQATKLREIMGRVGGQITETQSGVPATSKAPGGKGIKFLGFEK